MSAYKWGECSRRGWHWFVNGHQTSETSCRNASKSRFTVVWYFACCLVCMWDPISKLKEVCRLLYYHHHEMLHWSNGYCRNLKHSIVKRGDKFCGHRDSSAGFVDGHSIQIHCRWTWENAIFLNTKERSLLELPCIWWDWDSWFVQPTYPDQFSMDSTNSKICREVWRVSISMQGMPQISFGKVFFLL